MIFFYIILGIAIILILLMTIMPSHFQVKRSVAVHAPVDKAFEQVNELKNWTRWSSWYLMDPSQDMRYSDPSSGAKAWYTWDSKNKNVGKGKLTLEEVVVNEKIIQKLEFEKWGQSYSTMLFLPENNKVVVEWLMDNHLKGFMKLFGPMMKKQLEKSFDKSLQGIKREAESK